MFQWTPGHCNIFGNTGADEASRQAHRKDQHIATESTSETEK